MFKRSIGLMILFSTGSLFGMSYPDQLRYISRVLGKKKHIMHPEDITLEALSFIQEKSPLILKDDYASEYKVTQALASRSIGSVATIAYAAHYFTIPFLSTCAQRSIATLIQQKDSIRDKEQLISCLRKKIDFMDARQQIQFLAHGINKNQKELLYESCKKGYENITWLLVDYYLSRPSKSSDAVLSAALKKAVKSKEIGIASMLLSQGVNPDAGFGLFIALKNHDIRMVELLVQHRANINVLKLFKGASDLCSPLMFAYVHDAPKEIIEFLIKSGARVSHQCINYFINNGKVDQVEEVLGAIFNQLSIVAKKHCDTSNESFLAALVDWIAHRRQAIEKQEIYALIIELLMSKIIEIDSLELATKMHQQELDFPGQLSFLEMAIERKCRPELIKLLATSKTIMNKLYHESVFLDDYIGWGNKSFNVLEYIIFKGHFNYIEALIAAGFSVQKENRVYLIKNTKNILKEIFWAKEHQQERKRVIELVKKACNQEKDHHMKTQKQGFSAKVANMLHGTTQLDYLFKS